MARHCADCGSAIVDHVWPGGERPAHPRPTVQARKVRSRRSWRVCPISEISVDERERRYREGRPAKLRTLVRDF